MNLSLDIGVATSISGGGESIEINWIDLIN